MLKLCPRNRTINQRMLQSMGENGLNSKLKHRKAEMLYSGDLVTHTRDWDMISWEALVADISSSPHLIKCMGLLALLPVLFIC